MTHDELLAIIDSWIAIPETIEGDRKTWKTIRAVVELAKENSGEKPIDFEDDQYDQIDEAYWGGYDAGVFSAMKRVIQAIEKELK